MDTQHGKSSLTGWQLICPGGASGDAIVFCSSYRDWKTHPDEWDFISYPPRTGQSVCLIRDRSNSWYHNGVAGLGFSLPTVAMALEQRLLEAGKTLAAVAGASMGGYGALLLGALLGAPVTLAIVPQTTLRPADTERFKDTRFGDRYVHVQETTLTPELLGAREAFVHNPNGLRIVAYGDDPLDLLHVSALMDTRTVFIEVPERDHNLVATHMAKAGLLGALLSPRALSLSGDRGAWLDYIEPMLGDMTAHDGQRFFDNDT